MDPEEREENGGLSGKLSSFSENNMFNTEKFFDDLATDEEDAIYDFDGVERPEINNDDDNEDNDDIDFDENEEEDDEINFDEDESLTDEQKIDLEAFNKKFNKNFKTDEELKAFMDAKENEDNSVNEDEILESANNHLDILEPLLEIKNGRYVVDDVKLMTKEFETLALQNNQDLNDPDVQIEIEEKVQDLMDKGVLDIKANMLRENLKKIVDNQQQTKNSIIQKREALRIEQEKTEKENIQKELINFHNLDSFYGIKLNKKIVADAYKKISSGNFIENLKSDKKAMTELALIAEIKEEIFKKASGKTYNDGVKAILEEFKSKPKENAVAKAQQRRSAASEDSQDALIRSVLTEKPIKQEN